MTDDELDLLDRSALADARAQLAEAYAATPVAPNAYVSVHLARWQIADLECRLWWRQQMRDMPEALALQDRWTPPNRRASLILPDGRALSLAMVNFTSGQVGQMPSFPSDADPDFIIAGEWHDPNPHPILGPRTHPFGSYAHEETRGGVRRIYRDRAAWERHVARPDLVDESRSHGG